MRRRTFLEAGAGLFLSYMSVMLLGCDFNSGLLGVTVSPYPAKPIKMIVPYSTGGIADIMAILLQKYMLKYLGQSLIINNIIGGSGMLGWNELARAKPDGYTIGYVASSTLLQPLYGKTSYNYPSALEPLVQITSVPESAVVLADSSWQTIGDLVAYAKEHPGEIKFAHPGLGTSPHIVGEMFARVAGIKINQVPFNGDSEALAALLDGDVKLIFAPFPAIREHVKSGRISVLALSAPKRVADPVFKKVPTFKEQGYDVVMEVWHGIATPQRLAAKVKGALAHGFALTAKDPEFIAEMENAGMPVEYLSPDNFLDKWFKEMARLPEIVQTNGILDIIAKEKN
jgi:tripartite-type tricarboxylate transporter receptor subunit TctC